MVRVYGARLGGDRGARERMGSPEKGALHQVSRGSQDRAYVLPLDMLPVPGSVVASVAYWTPDRECLPYIVHHNPMTDPPILDVRDLLGKAQGVYATRDIFVIVLLPEIAALRGDLERGARCRVSHPENSIFVASMTDMSDFSVRVSSGALKHVDLVFPAASRDEVQGNAVWQLCQRHLSTDNCFLLEPERI